MKRLERLYGIVEFLRSRGQQPVTMGQLAAHFGITERTAYRDVRALRDQDVPIYGEPGQKGGIWLGGEYSMPPIGLSIGEAVGLWLALRMTQSNAPRAVGESLGTAFSKAMASLPDQRRRRYESVLNRIVVGVPPGPELVSNSSELSHSVCTEVERAVLGSFRPRFDYVDADGKTSTRDVDPHGLLVQSPLWYLMAYDLDRDAPRTFRLDRISRAVADETLRFEPQDPRELFKDIVEYELELPKMGI
jgi:predicted DNA-binding transcriptional regulator YafY